jgi:hypothetical protein
MGFIKDTGAESPLDIYSLIPIIFRIIFILFVLDYTDSTNFNSLQITGSTSDAPASNIFSVSSDRAGIFSVNNAGNVSITGSLNVSGSITGSLLGTASFATSASQAQTASFVNTLNQNIIISGSATIGSTTSGASENTLTLGARDTTSEGGQLGLNAPGGSYISASFIDLYQNRLRILKGTNVTSTGEVAAWNMHTLQMSLPAYTSAISFAGTSSAELAVDSSGNIITTPKLYRIVNNTDSAVISSSTALTLVYSQLIPANTFAAGDIVRLSYRGQKTNFNGGNSCFIYINTSSTVSGATLLGTWATTANPRMEQMDRKLYIKNVTTNTEMYNVTAPSAGEYTNTATSAFTNIAINWTIDQYIIFANTLASALDTFKGSSYEVERIRTT